ncbi:hypothetical protein FH593_04605 [Leptospira interrogans]|uniref:Uncharacterized protein n=5 Tax=Leptospira interrogans TaxID=173 RepID=A0AAP9WCB1_LEPIR|nr:MULTISPECIES: hypothetical protein [Leptospira]EMM80551.1 hypothetical protein LEP1GSC037_2144 [Leptospira interrogans str. 2006001854]EJP16987.1 hypothetical protein LEP1GSC080_2458 [Leptospira interrogans str. FPW2026]EKO86394.1 hypothetical protein LEP1GSC009_4375 [Leptospira interrogans serovar Grippotyphosa str. Andaman]EKP86831.1 hypothetical protein LEP1GSC020_2276 [Leptospira interrogans serovar Grippotyphosa str. 2006006986]EKR54904.1 hypothetical protein LEP1GSC105_3793 [Leptospir
MKTIVATFYFSDGLKIQFRGEFEYETFHESENKITWSGATDKINHLNLDMLWGSESAMRDLEWIANKTSAKLEVQEFGSGKSLLKDDWS